MLYKRVLAEEIPVAIECDNKGWHAVIHCDDGVHEARECNTLTHAVVGAIRNIISVSRDWKHLTLNPPKNDPYFMVPTKLAYKMLVDRNAPSEDTMDSFYGLMDAAEFAYNHRGKERGLLKPE